MRNDVSFESEPAIVECRCYLERALGSLGALHIGPPDYNVTQTVDDLLVAIRLLERFKVERLDAALKQAGAE